MRLAIACFVLLPLAALAPAQPPQPAPGDADIDQYLRQLTARVEQGYLEDVRTAQDWERIRPRLKEQYLEMLGLWPLPEKTPLRAAVTGAIDRDTFRVEKIHFQSKPGLYVTGNLYLPRKIEGKLPAVLYLCGHSNQGRDGNKSAYQHHGIWFATHGYVCLVLDTLQLGEIPGIHHGTYGIRGGKGPAPTRPWWPAAGYTPAGVECWNGVRGIDYLVSRAEVDPERIAVTGRSGGGAATFWIAAADERVKVAVPVSGMSDLETYVSDKVINGHCDCMFLINTYAWEWTTIAALIAPRPMLFLNSGRDTIFPMPGNERIRERLERLYRLYTPKPETLFDVGVTPGPHKDNLALRLMAYRWINRFLKKDDTDVDEPPVPRFTGPELRVFPEDKDLPGDALNGKIDETFVPRSRPALPENAEQYRAFRGELLDQLRRRAFHDWPDQVPAAELGRGESSGRLTFVTEPPLRVLAQRPLTPRKPRQVWLLVLGTDESLETIPPWAAPLVKDAEGILLLSPRGCGALKWTMQSPPNTIERSHALLGRTVDAGRVWDIQAVARYLHEKEDVRDVFVAGRGPSGILGAYAALFEPAISQVAAVDPPASHRDGPYFLNVLRFLDVPDALGLLAPTSLTLVNARDPGFERTMRIYKAAGAADRLHVR